MIRDFGLLLVAFASQCTTVAPSPPIIPDPPGTLDSGVPVHPTCADAYARQFALGCPPAEDAHFGWRDIDCPQLTQDKVDTIAHARSCKDTR